ncbi:MAG: xanthine dehydrogenase family protein molybdopterin-binding subunit [Pseudomonadota bacterium]|nr:xanthine dehydrogenase family protein molybdopterin-binding subunit [Pseudomonadota bacterium]
MADDRRPNRWPADGARRDALDKVSGEGPYTGDTRLPGMLEARVLRSPHAHAMIRAIDTTAARALPGVHLVATGADLGLLKRITFGNWVHDQPVLATDRVRYEGDMVAAVVAVDEATAFRALEAIRVDYQPLPPLMDIDAALAPDAADMFGVKHPNVHMKLGRGAETANEPRRNVLFDYSFTDGDVDAALATADRVFTDRFHFSRIAHFYMEPWICIADARANRAEVWTCNQDPFLLRQDLSEMFGLPEGHFRIRASYVGGGFGGKSYCKHEPLAVLLSMLAGQPVRLQFSLDESLLTLTQHAGELELTTGVMNDGTLVARRTAILLDGGAYADASAQVAVRAGYRAAGPYRWQAYDASASVIRTTTIPAGSYRGMGGTQASYASESQIDMIARRLGMDPLAFRHRNLIPAGVPFKTGDSAVDADFASGLDRVAADLRHQPAPAGAPVLRGKGFALGLKDGGSFGRLGKAAIKITTDGRVLVQCGAMEIGQGATTVISRLAADVLKVPVEWVRYAQVDTDTTPFDQGTHASCATALTGTAVYEAAMRVREQLLEIGAEELGCDISELDLAEWSIRRGSEILPLEPVIKRRYGRFGFEITGEGFIHHPKDPSAPHGAKHLYWMPHWVGVSLEVDTGTGMIRILDMVTGVDAGHAIHHGGVRGQDEGGTLVALAQSLFEEIAYTSDGAFATPTPLDYRVARAADLPGSYRSFILESGLGPGPMGAKGVGEAGMLGVAAAVANAIEDATGVRLTDMPFTPEKVLAALDAAGLTEPPAP